MSSSSAEAQAERILEELRSNPRVALPADVDVEDVVEAIDPTVPEPVNLNRVLEQFVRD